MIACHEFAEGRAVNVDQREIAAAAALLYRRASAGFSAAVATFPDTFRFHTAPRAIVLGPTADLPALVASTAEANPGSCIASPAATYRRGELVQALAVTLDMDTHPTESLARLRLILGPPTLVIASGTTCTCPFSGVEEDRLLAHWRLAEPALPEDHAALEEAAMLVAASVGFGFGCTAPVGAYARWPGTMNHRGQRRATIREANPEAEVDLATLTAVTSTMPLPMPGGRYATTLKWMAKDAVQRQWETLPWMQGKPHLRVLFCRMWGIQP